MLWVHIHPFLRGNVDAIFVVVVVVVVVAADKLPKGLWFPTVERTLICLSKVCGL